MLDLELQPGDAVDRSKWKPEISGYWYDSN